MISAEKRALLNPSPLHAAVAIEACATEWRRYVSGADQSRPQLAERLARLPVAA
ncbi:hypothetical protein [Streptosporangium longisporum]|uniref:Uncharacterized protein n=1 Tax=Streptosporangium longisporum TaxID=46187 RepID=A0ABP6L111_9ACTN